MKNISPKFLLILFWLISTLMVFSQPPSCTVSVTVTPSSGNQPARVVGNNQVLCIDGPGRYQGSITVNSGGHLVVCGGVVNIYGSVAIMPGGKYWRSPSSYITGSYVNYGSVSNNNSNCYSPIPEIKIEGNNMEILNGDVTPDDSDNTDFGMIEYGASISVAKGYTIFNTGDGDLTIDGPITSSNSQFVINQPSSLTISPGSSASFSIIFYYNSFGESESSIMIPNNDDDESKYSFKVRATTYTATLTSISSGVFEDPGNWDCNCTPSSIDNLIIDHDLLLTSTFENVSNRIFMVNAGVDLAIQEGNILKIGGDLINNGNITGDLALTGSSTQTPIIGNVTDLEIDNSSEEGVLLQNNLVITGELKLSSGVLKLNGYTLQMDASTSSSPFIKQMDCASYIDGEITLSQYVPESTYGHHYLSSPMSDLDLLEWEDDFDFNLSSHFPHLYFYDEPNGNWSIPNSSLENIFVGRGYTGYFPGEKIVDVYGTPNCGEIRIPITSDGDGWNLIGNPYPSSLNWDNVIIPDGLSPAIYRWDHIPSIWGRYATYIDGVGINGGTNVIPMMQGFFIYSSANTELKLQNSDRLQDNTLNSVFLSEKTYLTPSFRVSVSGFDNEIEIVVRFKESSSSSYEPGTDALLFPVGDIHGVDFATLSNDDERLVINTMSENDLLNEIPVYLKVPKGGVYVIDQSSFDNFSSTSRLFLLDKHFGEIHDFRNGQYEFNSGSFNSPDRFSLIIKEEALSSYQKEKLKAEIIKAGGGYAIKLDESNYTSNLRISIYNVQGQLIKSIPTIEGQIIYELPKMNHNLYLLKVGTQFEQQQIKWINN